MSRWLTKVHENPWGRQVCHPEFISGSQTMQDQEIPKRVRDDRGGLTGRQYFRVNRNKLSKWFYSSFYVIGFSSTLIGLSILVVLIIDILLDGAGRLGWQFFTSYPSRKPEAAGILSAWIGTVWIMVLTALLAVPLGIMAAIQLEEYSKKSWLTNLIEINIANLAGVPSIIYGLLGLGLFVRVMSLERG